MSAADPPEETEFLRLDEDGKHARKVPIRIAGQPAEPGTPNPVMIRVRYVSENEETIVSDTGQPAGDDDRADVMTETLEVPWGRIPARDFARDFAARIRSGGPAEIVVLARNSTETRWFQELLGLATAVCFITGRVPKNGEHYATQGQVALYFGTDAGKFELAWASRGIVWVGRWGRS
jgi:hypothetical protein